MWEVGSETGKEGEAKESALWNYPLLQYLNMQYICKLCIHEEKDCIIHNLDPNVSRFFSLGFHIRSDIVMDTEWTTGDVCVTREAIEQEEKYNSRFYHVQLK